MSRRGIYRHGGGILVWLLQRALHVIRGFLDLHRRLQLHGVVATAIAFKVLHSKVEAIEIFALGDVQSVFAVVELEHEAVAVAHCLIVLHRNALEMLDQAALQVS